MDMETGEDLRDKETGETPAKAKINTETGEEEINTCGPHDIKCRKKFRIENENNVVYKNNVKGCKRIPQPVMSSFIPALVYLMPTFVCFNPLIAACLAILEVFLHVWAHKKNALLKNKNIYYQSPLHIIVREFCASCREERSENKIANIQDKRNYKFIKYSIDYVHGIVT